MFKDFDPETRDLISSMLILAGLLLVVALGIQIVKNARRRAVGGDDPESLGDSFRDAYEAGEIDTDEYRQIRASLDRRDAPPRTPDLREPEERARPPSDDEADPPAPDGQPERGQATPTPDERDDSEASS